MNKGSSRAFTQAGMRDFAIPNPEEVFDFLLISAAAPGTKALFSGRMNPVQKCSEHRQQRSTSPPEAHTCQRRGLAGSSWAALPRDEEFGLEHEELQGAALYVQ